MNLVIEVDQSVKIEDTRRDSILAFSDHLSGAIRVPARVKRECLHILRERGQRGRANIIQIFAIALFVLLRQHLSRIDRVIVDSEYPGHQADIKAAFMRLVYKSGATFDADRLTFHAIGKKSRAHFLAYGVHLSRIQANRVLTLDDIRRWV